MRISFWINFCLLVVLVFGGCTAVSIQQTFWAANTSVAYDEEKKENIDRAETEYVNALARARRNNLTDNLSDSLYNLGSFYARQRRTPEAIMYLQESIKQEEAVSGSTSARTGKRIGALAAVYLMDNNINEGRPLAERLDALVPTLSGNEKEAAVEIVKAYDKQWKESNQQFQKWKPLADQGDATGLFNLAGFYEDGRVVEKDMNKAIELYQSAAGKGLINAQYYLGVIYDKGRGVQSDPVKAREWYRIAAEKGHAIAQYNYAVFLGKGAGGAKNEEEADIWMRKSADQGYPPAKAFLKRIKP